MKKYKSKNILYISRESVTLSVIDKIYDKYVCLFTQTAKNLEDNIEAIINELLTNCSNDLGTYTFSIDIIFDSEHITQFSDFEASDFVNKVLVSLKKLNTNVLSVNNYKDLINDESLKDQMILEIDSNKVIMNIYKKGKITKSENFDGAISLIKEALAEKYSISLNEIEQIVDLCDQINFEGSQSTNICCKIKQKFKEIEYITIRDFMNEYEIILSEIVNEIMDKYKKTSNANLYVLANEHPNLISNLKYQNWKVLDNTNNVIGLNESVSIKQSNSLIKLYEMISTENSNKKISTESESIVNTVEIDVATN